MNELYKYPRTQHLKDFTEGLEGKFVVVEEKMDGSQVGISFDLNEKPLFQSRGRFLEGNYERQFDLLKQWVNVHHNDLFKILGQRYIMFGEWMLMKHTIFYDMLPNYFLEFDVFDKETNSYISTLERHSMFMGTVVTSVAVLWNGIVDDTNDIETLIGNSLFKSAEWKSNFVDELKQARFVDIDRAFRNTDNTNLMEGLYIKIEHNNNVQNRLKFIRPDFIATIVNSTTHWVDNNTVLNRLRPGTNLWR
jgi:hypothetical protein